MLNLIVMSLLLLPAIVMLWRTSWQAKKRGTIRLSFSQQVLQRDDDPRLFSIVRLALAGFAILLFIIWLETLWSAIDAS